MSFGIVLIFFWFALFCTLGEAFVCLRDAQQKQLRFGIGHLMRSLVRISRKPTPANSRLIIPKRHGIVPVVPRQERVGTSGGSPLVVLRLNASTTILIVLRGQGAG
jgi:hypothetical protein